jgi:hypothetical protein
MLPPDTSEFWIARPLNPRPIRTAESPGAQVLQLTRVFLIVTLFAWTLIPPLTSSPSMTAPGVVTVMLPLGVRLVPCGTPTLWKAGSG